MPETYVVFSNTTELHMTPASTDTNNASDMPLIRLVTVCFDYHVVAKVEDSIPI